MGRDKKRRQASLGSHGGRRNEQVSEVLHILCLRLRHVRRRGRADQKILLKKSEKKSLKVKKVLYI